MRSFILILGLLAAFALVSFAIDVDEVKFREYLRKYSKKYTTDEYTVRFGHFKNTLNRIHDLDIKQPLAKYAVDKFSDMSRYEFRNKYLLTKFDPNEQCQWPYSRLASPSKLPTATPTSWDWRSQNPSPVVAVKDQGGCGSCWAFSTAANVEGVWALNGKQGLVSLSEQWSVDCSKSCLASEPDLCNGGCGGGLPWLAYEDIIKLGFLPTEQAYSYTGSDGSCKNVSKSGATISNWTAVESDISTIEAFLVQNGPLSITLNADLLFSYSSGIITGTDTDCPGSESDHAVLLVGFGTDPATNVHYWIVKNSWGLSWGEKGYFRIQADNGLCGTSACVTSAVF